MTVVELVAPQEDVLARVRAAVEPSVRAALEELPDETREVVESGLRRQDFSTAALVLLSAEACGGADVTAAATALEFASLHERLHADLMTRSRRPGARAEFGRDRVVSAADALLCLAFARLDQSQALILNVALMSVVDGYLQEIEMGERDDTDLSEHLGVAAAKHSALTAAACRLGALAAGASRSRADHLREFGDDIGLARKHVDDVLDQGEDAGGLPVVAAAAGAEDGRAWCVQQADLLHARALGHLRQAGLGEAEDLARFARSVTIARCAPVVPVQPTGD
ncbi:polyprenyl synthetase family protein [Lentzea sp. NPDC059081]|uniref:polyprenyl synthetase family protein n=1 Tax=Lentzea sp. NPDC059081 TaxID=3346719 RepID=UPI0036798764